MGHRGLYSTLLDSLGESHAAHYCGAGGARRIAHSAFFDTTGDSSLPHFRGVSHMQDGAPRNVDAPFGMPDLRQLPPLHMMKRNVQHTAHLGTSFTEEQEATAPPAGSDEAAAKEEGQQEQDEQDAADAPGRPKIPGWTNVEGLPTVKVTSNNDKYLTPDLADAEGDGKFKPIFGCKCGNWDPAPTHPTIAFRPQYIKEHPTFIKQLRFLKVKMEDTTAGKVHWDAMYDMKRFLSPEDRAAAAAPGGTVSLTDTTPAKKGSGSQVRFMTFCPPEAAPGDAMNPPKAATPHEYTLKVTALDADETPIPGFKDEESRYTATPPEPEEPPGPMNLVESKEVGPIIASPKIGQNDQKDLAVTRS